MGPRRGSILAAEMAGTFVLVLGGCGTAVISGTQVGTLGIALAFGLSLLCMAYAVGGTSGCHINPAVTLGLVMAGKCRREDAPVYVLGQAIGGILAGAVIFAIGLNQDGSGLGPKMTATALRQGGLASNGFGSHSPGHYTLLAAILVEVILTGVLVFVVCSTYHRSFPGGFGGIAVGLTLTVIHLISIPVDNTSVNPARSLGVALFAGDWAIKQLWVFLLFPLVGGALGATSWKLLTADSETSVRTA